MIRCVVATVSSIDVLVAGLRQHSANWEGMSEEQRTEASGATARLTGCLTLAISHAVALSVRATATCTQTRRKAALDNATLRDIPDPLREWLLCQPLAVDKSSIFGSAIPTLMKEMSVDVNELRKGMALMAKPSRSESRPAESFGRGQKRKKSFGRGSAPQYQASQPHGQSSGRGRNNSRRHRRGKGKARPSFTFPNPAAGPPKGEPSQRS